MQMAEARWERVCDLAPGDFMLIEAADDGRSGVDVENVIGGRFVRSGRRPVPASVRVQSSVNTGKLEIRSYGLPGE